MKAGLAKLEAAYPGEVLSAVSGGAVDPAVGVLSAYIDQFVAQVREASPKIEDE